MGRTDVLSLALHLACIIQSFLPWPSLWFSGKASSCRATDLGSILTFGVLLPGQVIPVTKIGTPIGYPARHLAI